MANESFGGVKLYLASVVTILAIAGYGFFVWLMWGRVDDAELRWGREILLLTGVEAITFAAVGWLFGKEVNRGQAESADKANKDAQESARDAGAADAKGRALADAIRANSATSQSLQPEANPLLELANRLYPAG